MSRSYKVIPVDLTTGAPTAPVEIGAYKYLYVASMPPGAEGAVLIGIDKDSADFPLRTGLVLGACDGAPIARAQLASPPFAGLLLLAACNEDLRPFSGGSAATGAADLRRVMEQWWLPGKSAAAGGAFEVTGWPATDPFWSASNLAGAGLAPIMTVRNMRCALALPQAGGQSGFIGLFSWPWARLRAEPGVGGGTLLARTHPRVLSFNLEMLLRCDGQGASHAVGGLATGMQLLQSDGTKANLAGNIAGFGIVRDGVAGALAWWRFVACALDGAGLSINVPLPRPLGADVRRWARFRIEVADADPVSGREGRVNVYQDDVPVLAFGDADMPNFPPSSDGALRTGFVWQLVNQSLQADALLWARGHWWVDAVLGGGA
jgi:hypothetical protein